MFTFIKHADLENICTKFNSTLEGLAVSCSTDFECISKLTAIRSLVTLLPRTKARWDKLVCLSKLLEELVLTMFNNTVIESYQRPYLAQFTSLRILVLNNVHFDEWGDMFQILSGFTRLERIYLWKSFTTFDNFLPIPISLPSLKYFGYRPGFLHGLPDTVQVENTLTELGVEVVRLKQSPIDTICNSAFNYNFTFPSSDSDPSSDLSSSNSSTSVDAEVDVDVDVCAHV